MTNEEILEAIKKAQVELLDKIGSEESKIILRHVTRNCGICFRLQECASVIGVELINFRAKLRKEIEGD